MFYHTYTVKIYYNYAYDNLFIDKCKDLPALVKSKGLTVKTVQNRTPKKVGGHTFFQNCIYFLTF